jgi:hypothetical protein
MKKRGEDSMRRLAIAFAFQVVLTAPLSAQFAYPVPVIERRMRDEPLIVDSLRGSRMQVDRTQRVFLNYGEEGSMQVKWAKAPRDGGEFNNEPRYEIAAYELQKLFLDEADYVVPPTVGRAVPFEWFRQYDASAPVTFRGINSVVLAVQYWMTVPLSPNFWQESLFQVDTLYARHLANFNVLTYLMKHSDTNSGNYLVMLDARNPRVFTVDNGVAFRSEPSDRGYLWRELRVDRLPRATVDRLRAITEEDLHRALGVLLQFEVRNQELVAVPITANMNDGRGVRRSDTHVQFGLTRPEIRDVYNRLTNLLERVDSGRIKVF